MAITLTTRPAEWVAVKNPVVYKFTSTGLPLANYRIEIEVFKSSDNTSLTGGVKFSFTPNAAGITFVDISTIVKAYLKAEWANPVALNEVEIETSLKVYIKYQELYDASAASVVDDVANPIHCVFAALQIPSLTGGDLINYVPIGSLNDWLTKFTRPKIWRGYPFTVSIIFPDAVALVLRREQNNISGGTLGVVQQEVLTTHATHGAVNRVDVLNGFVIDPEASEILLMLLSFTGTPTLLLPPEDWTPIFGAGFVSPHGNTDSNNFYVENPTAGSAIIHAFQAVNVPNGQPLFTFQYSVTVVSGSFDIIFALLDAGNGTVSNTETVTVSTPGTTTHTVNLTSTGAATKLWIQVVATGTPFEMFVELLNIGQSLFFPGFLQITKHLTLDVVDPCENPVMLEWKNSVGGDAWWLFDHNQEASYNYSGSKKAKRMSLSVNNLTVNEWEALNELNTLGEVYRNNIVEFTALTDKTAVRNDAQVYVVNADGSKTGVIVLPTNNILFTHQKRHTFHVEIEFPEVQ